MHAGPIPVELLRWKFVEGRKIELKGNAGLELPSNIGELGGNKLGGTITDDIAAFTKLTSLDLGGMDLKGTFVV